MAKSIAWIVWSLIVSSYPPNVVLAIWFPSWEESINAIPVFLYAFHFINLSGRSVPKNLGKWATSNQSPVLPDSEITLSL